MKGLVIAMDGPSGTGKSTAARGLARKLGFLYLDTGAMYRAVALKALRSKVGLDHSTALTRLAERARISFRRGPAGKVKVFLDGLDVTRAIRRPEVSEAASRAAVVPGVRRAMVKQQRRIGRAGGIVAEGRDIGTVVFPKAPLKFFMTASLAERARRRCEELKEAGHPVSLAQVRREVHRRDQRDRSRSVAPLRPARGAIRLDNTKLQSGQVLDILLAYVQRSKSNANPN